MRDRATRGKNQRVAKLLSDPNVTHLLYENGMARGTITVDPKGFLGDSFYRQSLNEQVQRAHDKTSCSAHIQEHLRQDSSKRPQPGHAHRDLPAAILSGYVFIPTQKFADVSVKNSRISYPQLLQQAAEFCLRRGTPLVIKIHPHLVGQERREQEWLIQKLRRRHALIFLSNASINFLTANALFTVTLNGGTLMDNFYTQSPVLALASGFFDRTDALVRDDSVERGMERMLKELPWSEEHKLRQRQVVCWYDRMCLKAVNTAAHNVGVLQAHLDALRLPLPIVL